MNAISKRIGDMEQRRRRRNRDRAGDGSTPMERILARLAAIRTRLEASQPAVPGTDIQISLEQLDGAIDAFTNDTTFPSGVDVQVIKQALYADVEFMQSQRKGRKK